MSVSPNIHVYKYSSLTFYTDDVSNVAIQSVQHLLHVPFFFNNVIFQTNRRKHLDLVCLVS